MTALHSSRRRDRSVFAVTSEFRRSSSTVTPVSGAKMIGTSSVWSMSGFPFIHTSKKESISKSNEGSQRLNEVAESVKVITDSASDVKVLIDGYQEAGHHTVRFDGSGLATGVYLYRLSTEDRVITRRMHLLR